MPSEADLYIGRTLDGRWRVDEFCAEGNFSIVLKGVDLRTNNPIAVKVLRISSSTDARLEMEREIDLLDRLLTCDRVVDIVGSGEDTLILQNYPFGPSGPTIAVPVKVQYIVLEQADGCLAELFVELDKIGWKERLALFRDIVKGVHQMHLKQIVSRDLKSDNILLFTTAGFTTTAKVADFGRSSLTQKAPLHIPQDYLMGRGDLRFAPPELLWLQGINTAQYWASVDLYHLGSILFEFATGFGLTSIVLPNAIDILRSSHGLSESDRKIQYQANIGQLRAQMQFAWELFDEEVPSAIRGQAGRLLRQLTDPDPLKRFPTVLGHPGAPNNGLEWLIRQADILRLALAKSDSQTARLRRRKQMNFRSTS